MSVDFEKEADWIAVQSRQITVSCVDLKNKIAAFGRRCYEAGREACEENHVIKTVERSEFCHHDDPSWCTEKCKGRNR